MKAKRRKETNQSAYPDEDFELGYLDDYTTTNDRPFIRKEFQFKLSDNEPWRFLENDTQYRICCGLAHIKTTILFLTAAKTCFVIWFAISSIFLDTYHAMFALTSIFGMALILSSYAFLIIGVTVKKYKLLIPYFTLSLFLILILMMKLFIDVIGTANTKDTLELNKLQLILGQVMIISIEIYSVFLVWKIFNYITDYYMEKDYLCNVTIAQQRKMWEMEYTKGFDEFVREMEKETRNITMRKSSVGSNTSLNTDAEPYLQKPSRPSIHKSSQPSTTTTSE